MMSDLLSQGSAIFSPDGLYRHRLDRTVQASGLVFLFAGVNPSRAGADVDDQTSKKWFGFTLRNDGRKYIAINPFDLIATDVEELSRHPAPVSTFNAGHILQAIAEADILVPCWGNRHKIRNNALHSHLDALRDLFFASGKPVKTFGFTKSGDPKHPQMLGYDTQLIDWMNPKERS